MSKFKIKSFNFYSFRYLSIHTDGQKVAALNRGNNVFFKLLSTKTIPICENYFITQQRVLNWPDVLIKCVE